MVPDRSRWFQEGSRRSTSSGPDGPRWFQTVYLQWFQTVYLQWFQTVYLQDQTPPGPDTSRTRHLQDQTVHLQDSRTRRSTSRTLPVCPDFLEKVCVLVRCWFGVGHSQFAQTSWKRSVSWFGL